MRTQFDTYIGKLKNQKEILESEGYKVFLIALYGSQNYGLDIESEEYQSDVDMKAIVVPTLDDLVENSKPVSKIVKTEWGECDVKDIRIYFETLLKGNPAYIETLFTKYCIVDENFINEFTVIHSLKEELVNTLKIQLIRAMYGMMGEKEKAMCHPYPSIAHKIEKFGYDGKQSHHILRLWLMMKDYFELNKPLEECFYPIEEFKQYLIDLKLNRVSLKEAKELISDIMAEAREFRDFTVQKIDEDKIDYSIKDEFIKISQDIIKQKIIYEIRGDTNS